MTNNTRDNYILYFSLPLFILLVISSCAGLFLESTYSMEIIAYAAQGIGQDFVNLILASLALIISALFTYRKNKTGLLIWSGVVFYIAYSYMVYCFGLHFNSFFIVYCLILGLSFYAFINFIFKSLNEEPAQWFKESVPVKSTAVFLLIITCVFYFLWLSEIIPAIIRHETPKSITENGLMTNPVHILDLAFCLPAIILTSVKLLQKRGIGYLLVPAMLVFCLLMAAAIAAMMISMKIKGFEAEIMLPVIFGILTLISAVFLIRYLMALK